MPTNFDALLNFLNQKKLNLVLSVQVTSSKDKLCKKKFDLPIVFYSKELAKGKAST
jgi:hypothetical protein